LNIKHVKVATASPQSNGQVERVNRFLRSVLSKLSVLEAVRENTYNLSIRQALKFNMNYRALND